MTTPISSVVALQAFAPQRRADPQAPVAAEALTSASGADAAAASDTPSKPIALSVDRDASGVFVYTLTDSASGRVLAVIPRSSVVTSAQQPPTEGVDIQA